MAHKTLDGQLEAAFAAGFAVGITVQEDGLMPFESARTAYANHRRALSGPYDVVNGLADEIFHG